MAKLDVVREGSVAVLYLNRPEVLNAVDQELSSLLRLAVEREIGTASAICLRARGRAFCSGGDLRALESDDDLALSVMEEMRGTLQMLRAASIPVIAYVQGAAVGGGSEIAASAHILCASPGASFQFPQTQLHLSPGWGGGAALASRIGRGRALELLVSARRIGVVEARAIGLVDRIVTPVGFPEFLRLPALQDRELAQAQIAALRADRDGEELSERQFAALWRGDAHRQAVRRFRTD